MNIPTEEDWQHEPCDPKRDLDRASAYRNFIGKSMDEAVRMFEYSALDTQEDLMYMPRVPFQFYVMAYVEYIMSDAATEDSDGASCFVLLIKYKAENEPDHLRPVWNAIEPALKHIVEIQQDFGAEWEIYGSFRAEVHEVVQRGFSVTFDTATPEVVPTSVRISDVRTRGPFKMPVAVQLFHNSGITEINVSSQKPDILRIFGPPDNSGGGPSQYGMIGDWIHYHRTDCVVRFQFDGDTIASVTFMPPVRSSCPPPELGTVEALLYASESLFRPPDPKDPPLPSNSLTRAYEEIVAAHSAFQQRLARVIQSLYPEKPPSDDQS